MKVIIKLSESATWIR